MISSNCQHLKGILVSAQDNLDTDIFNKLSEQVNECDSAIYEKLRKLQDSFESLQKTIFPLTRQEQLEIIANAQQDEFSFNDFLVLVRRYSLLQQLTTSEKQVITRYLNQVDFKEELETVNKVAFHSFLNDLTLIEDTDTLKRIMKNVLQLRIDPKTDYDTECFLERVLCNLVSYTKTTGKVLIEI